MKNFSKVTLLAVGLFATTLLMGGCSTTYESSDLRDNWSPELYSTAQTYDQNKNMTSRHRQNYMRQIKDDWDFIWLQDRNLRLTRYNLP